MRTIKRNIPDIDTTIANTTKYFNQFEFKGIIEDNNIFAIDQESCRDAMNIYVSFDDRLKSRPTLQHEDIPSVFNTTVYLGYNLVEIKRFGSSYIYVFEHDNRYYVVYYDDTILEIGDDDNLAIDDLTSYHLSSIEHYIICFNNDTAKIIDTNKVEDGWYDLTNQVYIPTTQITTGANTVDAEASNDFTGQSKHQYNWSNSSQPVLPEGNAEVTLITTEGKQESYELTNANINTDYRILKKITLTNDNGQVSIVNNIIAVAYSTYCKISYNDGITFDVVYYDEYTGNYLNVGTLSDDGQYFFYIAEDGVHRYNLSTKAWSYKFVIETGYSLSSKTIISYKFLTGDIFAFFSGEIQSSTNEVNATLCVKGPKVIYRNTTIDNTYNIAYTSELYSVYREENFLDGMKVSNYKDLKILSIDSNGENVTVVSSIVKIDNTVELDTGFMIYCSDFNFKDYNFVMLLEYNPGPTVSINKITDINSLNVVYSSNIVDTYNTTYNLKVDMNNISEDTSVGITTYNQTQTFNINISYNSQSEEITSATSVQTGTSRYLGYYNGVSGGLLNFKLLSGGYIAEYKKDTSMASDDKSGIKVFGLISSQWTYIPDEAFVNIGIDGNVFTYNDNFYIVKYDNSNIVIYTNKLYTNSVTNEEDVAQIVYTVGSAGSYNKVPQVSYADTELYLGFNKLLQISQNTKDENNNLLLYLPTTNNQSFIDDITGMINISTTEVALFFKNKITICSKVQDSNLPEGYRYDYYNTKLSLGIRLYDSIINTLEGSYTIFPTKRGLAIMNYQAFMATTDQVVEYMTDHIPALWALFYGNDDDSTIKIMQWRTYLVLTNGTGEMLLYNLSTNAWWRWTIPVSVMHLLTDQEKLYVVSNGLYIFKDQKELTYDNELSAIRYSDFSETQPNGIAINWRIISQPLHFKAPTYYKNIKQIIFQFYDIDEQNVYNKTLNAQIKLYRKRITITEPETIDFKIEGLRTFVKRFNYWKINELQWAISNDDEMTTPAQFEINNVSIKYEIGDEVR